MAGAFVFSQNFQTFNAQMIKLFQTGILGLLLSLGTIGLAQSFPPGAYLQGYAHQNDTTYFLFDQSLYGDSQPTKVVVTGSFRNWSHDMEEMAWTLSPHIAIYNPDFSIIPPQSEFKFRINQGEWLSPPANAPNVKGGNLVFMKDITPPTIKAEISRSGTIWITTDGFQRPLFPHAYRLTDAQGHEVPIGQVLPHETHSAILLPKNPIDIRRIYWLEVPAVKLKTWCNFDGYFREMASAKALGANVDEEAKQTTFRIFSPRAEAVRLYLYHNHDDELAYQEVQMEVDGQGVWEATFEANLKGTYYDFTVHGATDEGNHFFETQPVHISDPYARVNMDAWGRSRVWTKTKPAKPLKKGIPALEDVISYEVHIQDFTDRLPINDGIKGTFEGFRAKGLTNSQKQPIGFDYLVDLGINVVHLMPVQEFMHHPDDEWRASFENDPLMQSQGVHLENYQWGYRTSHAFAVENRYRTAGTEPGAEREQFRDLVQAFHDKDMAVIIDIVPNHTAEDMDGGPHFFHWNVLDKLYYYRTKNLKHIGEYGNEVKTENRPMVQRWLIDQCLHWIDEFGVDGFRIDLAGQIDRQTLIKLREAIGPDIILYGEPWIASNDPEYENNPSWDWYKHNSPITFFQDETRNAFQGSPFILEVKDSDRGYAGGNYKLKEKVKQALSASFEDDKSPLSGINYLDIHDNWTLADRFAEKNWDGRKGVDEIRYKIAAVLLYTSLGPIVTHGGSEMMRSKGAAPLEELVKTHQNGMEVHIKSRDDTYNLRTPNQFIWENVGKTKRSKGSLCDYKGMHAYWRGLNKFRMSEAGKVFRQAEPVSEKYFQWIETVNPYQLGYLVDEKVLVLLNVGGEPHLFPKVSFPKGTWRLVADNLTVDMEKGAKGPSKTLRVIKGGASHPIPMDGPSVLIWVKE